MSKWSKLYPMNIGLIYASIFSWIDMHTWSSFFVFSFSRITSGISTWGYSKMRMDLPLFRTLFGGSIPTRKMTVEWDDWFIYKLIYLRASIDELALHKCFKNHPVMYNASRVPLVQKDSAAKRLSQQIASVAWRLLNISETTLGYSDWLSSDHARIPGP